MKYNKKITIICLILMLVSLTLVILIPAECVKMSGLVISLFTGFLVSSIIGISGYLHEKNNVLNSTYVYLSEIHRKLSGSEKKTSELLLNFSDLKDFRNIMADEGALLRGISNSRYNKLIDYHSFRKNNKLSKCIYRILGLSSLIDKLTIEISIIKEEGIQHEIFKLQSQRQTNEIQLDEVAISNAKNVFLDKLKNSISLIHELEKELLSETNRLGEELSTLYGFNMKWDVMTQT